MTEVKDKMYHIKLSSSDISTAKVAILPGNPDRVSAIALEMDKNSVKLASNREYTSYLSEVSGVKILVCSTGIGGPSTAIAVEELAKIGITNFIRLGTTGAIQKEIEIGDVIISSSAVRLDGTSSHYAPIEYPAVADYNLTHNLMEASSKNGIEARLGITASSDTFYPGQERYDSYSGYVRKTLQGTLAEWQKLNVLNYEMESASLFVMCSALNLKAAAIYMVIANRCLSEIPDSSQYQETLRRCIHIVKDSILQNNKLN